MPSSNPISPWPDRVMMYLEGVAVPVLAVHRNHVRVPRKHDAGPILRSQRGVQIGLSVPGVVDEAALDPEAGKITLDELDQGQVGIAAGRVKPDQFPDHVDAAEIGGAHFRHDLVSKRRRQAYLYRCEEPGRRSRDRIARRNP